jgi:photosystem II stability/assembly factor-like uncharacterized protein
MVEESQALDFTHMVVKAGGGLHFAARQSGLYVSSDDGDNWHDAYRSLGLDEDLATTAVAVSPDFAQDGLVFAGVAGGVMRSADGGKTWTLTRFNDPPPLVTALGVSPVFSRDGVVLAGTLEDGVFRSDDCGQTWKAWNFGLLDWRVLALALSPDFSEDHKVVIGTESGLFVSKNGGRSWRVENFLQESAPVVGVKFDDKGRIWAETEEQGWGLI